MYGWAPPTTPEEASSASRHNMRLSLLPYHTMYRRMSSSVRVWYGMVQSHQIIEVEPQYYKCDRGRGGPPTTDSEDAEYCTAALLMGWQD